MYLAEPGAISRLNRWLWIGPAPRIEPISGLLGRLMGAPEPRGRGGPQGGHPCAITRSSTLHLKSTSYQRVSFRGSTLSLFVRLGRSPAHHIGDDLSTQGQMRTQTTGMSREAHAPGFLADSTFPD